MSGATAPKFLNQAEFARRRKVSRKSVTTWKSKGLLVLNEAGQVDVEATEWKLDERPPKYRGGVTHRPVRAADGYRVSPAPRVALEAAKVTPESDTLEEEEAEISPENLPMAEAVRRKENFLGLLRKHEFEVGQKEWVRVEDVGQLVERDYATVRERMLVMPGKMASRLVGLSQAEIERLLRQEATETLNELHDPDSIAGSVALGDAASASEEGVEAAADPERDRVGGPVSKGRK